MSARVYVPGRAEAAPEREVGGKAHQLEKLRALAAGAGFTVPRFVVVPAAAFDEQVGRDRPWPPDAEGARARAEETRRLALPEALAAELTRALAGAGLDHATLAVRSSAVGEDGATRSFAGQFDTVLGVRGDDLRAVWEAVRTVWASAFNAWAAAYGAGGGTASPVRMAVVIQELVDPRVSGVAFSADPVSGAREVAVVSAVYGLGEGLVSGELDADTYRVRFENGTARVESTLARKTHAVRPAPGGRTTLEPVPEAAATVPALPEREAVEVARAARTIESRFGAPQDVEWAYPRQGALVVLQARPITTLRRARWVWDNSNIIESYSGVTTPLTFTFAREVYESVYRQFCRLMGTPEAQLESHRPVFAHMLALVRGRVYYDLLNWYRTLALLPGFQWNRAFMERMMGEIGRAHV